MDTLLIRFHLRQYPAGKCENHPATRMRCHRELTAIFRVLR